VTEAAEMNDVNTLKNLRSNIKKERNDALKDVYASCYEYVKRYIISNNGTVTDAKDIFQDAIIIMYEKVQNEDFKLTCTFKTYLYSISKNIWLNKLRKKGSIIQLEVEYEEVAIDSNALEKLEQNELNKYYEQLLDQVDTESQKVLRLYYFEKKKMKDIAKIMGYANEQVAKNKKLRSLKKLRALLFNSQLKYLAHK